MPNNNWLIISQFENYLLDNYIKIDIENSELKKNDYNRNCTVEKSKTVTKPEGLFKKKNLRTSTSNKSMLRLCLQLVD